MSAWEGSAWQRAREEEAKKAEAKSIVGSVYLASAAKQDADNHAMREDARQKRERQDANEKAEIALRAIYDRIRQAAMKGERILSVSDYDWMGGGLVNEVIVEKLQASGYRVHKMPPCMDPGTNYQIRWDG